MSKHTPDKRLLLVWRINLVVLSIPFAFAIALLLKVGTFWWYLLSAVWVVLFLSCYLVYLPLFWKSIAYSMKENQIRVNSGVFLRRRRSMDLSSVQYLTLSQAPVSRLFGLASLIFSAPGGRLYLPGFPLDTARRLFEALSHPDEEAAL